MNRAPATVKCVDEWIACPHCLALAPAVSDRCPHCRQDVDWVRDMPELRRALAFSGAPPERPWRLRVEARWAMGQLELTRCGPGALELIGPAGETMQIGVDAFGEPLQLVDESGVATMDLPGESEWRGLHLQARLEAISGSRRTEERVADFRPGDIRLRGNQTGIVIGKRIDPAPSRVSVSEERLEGDHCLIVRQRRNPPAHWIVDLRTGCGTFVNHREILVHRLQSGDLVQLAGYAWLYSAADEMLIPVRGIEGVRLQVRGVDRLGKLGQASFDVEPGELVAVCGRSGAGKSTLLEALVGGRGSRDCGSIYADGRDIEAAEDGYRSVLGYVSQRPFVHEDLTARQAVTFSARLRLGSADRDEAADVLRQIDLAEERWEASPRNLSGGEANRVRTATELISQPRLFLLDEPTSGLDPDSEVQLLSFLRSLSLRGCTVVAVIHSLHRLSLFDRVLVVGDGGLRFNGTPEELRGQIASGEFLDLDYDQLEGRAPPTLSEVKAAPAEHRSPPAGKHSSWAGQLNMLLARETALICNQRWKRLILPVALMPAVFAMATATVPSHEPELLGFLCVLSAIWLGASLTSLCIAGEREVYEHERRLFLRPSAYVAAKTFMFYGLTAVQAVVFFTILLGARHFAGYEQLRGLFWPLAYLLPVACAGAGMGLVLSACVGRNQLGAGFVLPLLMMVQIVFSAQVAGKGKEALERAYPAPLLERGGAAAENAARGARGPVMAGSYLTVSRWGEMALRSFAYGSMEYEAFIGAGGDAGSIPVWFDYAGRRRAAMLVLAAILASEPLLALLVLMYATGGQRVERPAVKRSAQAPS